jgi:protease I
MLRGKRVVLVIPSRNFRDEELTEPLALLRQLGAEVRVASPVSSPVQGMLGKIIKPDLTLAQVRVTELDALVFIGGSGANLLWDDPQAHDLAVAADNAEKVLGAICIAPVTLARAGVLKGRKATCFPAVVGELKQAGATLVPDKVVCDGRLVTAFGPEVAKAFALKIAQALQ